MRSLKILTFAILTILIFVPFANAKNNEPVAISSDRDMIIENLLIGLQSNNLGLRTSSAYILGELNTTKAVIPLLRILHQSDVESERIMAAISLYKIGTGISIFALKQSGRLDNSERVRKVCTYLYKDYVLNHQ